MMELGRGWGGAGGGGVWGREHEGVGKRLEGGGWWGGGLGKGA